LYDFESAGDDELSLTEGERVEFIFGGSDDAEWAKVRRIGTGEEGVVPASYIEASSHPLFPDNFVASSPNRTLYRSTKVLRMLHLLLLLVPRFLPLPPLLSLPLLRSEARSHEPLQRTTRHDKPLPMKKLYERKSMQMPRPSSEGKRESWRTRPSKRGGQRGREGTD